MLGHFLEALEDSMRLASLARPIFHSEADFQLELAYQLRIKHRAMTTRLEVPLGSLGLDSGGAIDLVLAFQSSVCLVELKYAKARAEVIWREERYSLPAPAADVGRYGFLKDLERLEHYTARHAGLALLLTNDSRLWTESGESFSDREFRLHEGRTVTGQLDWAPGTAQKTRASNPAIHLRGNYTMRWRQYSTEPVEFRYLVVAVRPELGEE